MKQEMIAENTVTVKQKILNEVKANIQSSNGTIKEVSNTQKMMLHMFQIFQKEMLVIKDNIIPSSNPSHSTASSLLLSSSPNE